MKKSQEPAPLTGNRRVRPSYQDRVDNVFSELEVFLNNPRADEILLNEWLHDVSLPIPSAELLDFFAAELLYNLGKYSWRHCAETTGIKNTIKKLVLELKATPQAIVRVYIDITLKREKLLSFSVVNKGGTMKNSLSWWLALWSYWGDYDEKKIFPEGNRRLAQHMLQSMMLRAVFCNDVTRLEGLAEAVRVHKRKSKFNPPQAHQIAFMMFTWMPYLKEKLGRFPQKSEMQFFLLKMYPDLSDSPKEWSAAAKSIRFQTSERGKKADFNLLLKIVREATKDGPKVKKRPSFRCPH